MGSLNALKECRLMPDLTPGGAVFFSLSKQFKHNAAFGHRPYIAGSNG
jgi:hypothetical protein